MKVRTFLITGMVLAAVGAGGYFGWQYLTEENGENGKTVYVTAISALSQTASGTQNRYAGVVEPQETLEIKLENGRKVSEVNVEVGQEIKAGDVLFEYDLSSIEDDLEAAQLDYDQLLNEAEGIKEQIITYTKEQEKANKDQQLSYTIQIETAKMSLKKNEYNQKSKAAEIERLQRSMGETEVIAAMDGVVTKIDTTQMESEDGSTFSGDMGMGSMGSSGSNAFITILSTGAYRIKGKVNEQNYQDIIPGSPVIIRSRVDEERTWRGTMGSIDTESTNDNNSSYYFGMMDSQTTSSSYNFYVNMEEGADLMLGQHVYIEMDEGQEQNKDGIWLNDYFIAELGSETPYVWGIHAEGDALTRIPVRVGSYDAALGQMEILEGLSEEDYIAFPVSSLTEGMKVIVTQDLQLMVETAYELEQSSSEETSDTIPEWKESEFSGEGAMAFDQGGFDPGEIIDGEELSDIEWGEMDAPMDGEGAMMEGWDELDDLAAEDPEIGKLERPAGKEEEVL